MASPTHRTQVNSSGHQFDQQRLRFVKNYHAPVQRGASSSGRLSASQTLEHLDECRHDHPDHQLSPRAATFSAASSATDSGSSGGRRGILEVVVDGGAVRLSPVPEQFAALFSHLIDNGRVHGSA